MRKPSAIMDVPAKPARKKKPAPTAMVSKEQINFDEAVRVAIEALGSVLGVLEGAKLPHEYVRDQLDKISAVQNAIVDYFEEDPHGN